VSRKDVTDLVEVGEPDGECAPLLRCVCGAKFGRWDNVLNIYEDLAHEQGCCERRLYVGIEVRVYEVVPDGGSEG
jgi:hypothetical protein